MEERIVATNPDLFPGHCCQLIDQGLMKPKGYRSIILLGPGIQKPIRRYQFSWYAEQQRLGGSDFLWLKRRRPELIAWLEMVCPLLWKAPGDSQ
jgi:hypothetical protein